MKPGLLKKEAVMTKTEIIKLFEEPAIQVYRDGNNALYFRRRKYEIVRKDLTTGEQEVCAFMTYIRSWNRDGYWKAITKKIDILWHQSLLFGNFTDDPYWQEYHKLYIKSQPALKWLKKITDDEILSITDQPHEFGSDLDRMKRMGRRW